MTGKQQKEGWFVSPTKTKVVEHREKQPACVGCNLITSLVYDSRELLELLNNLYFRIRDPKFESFPGLLGIVEKPSGSGSYLWRPHVE